MMKIHYCAVIGSPIIHSLSPNIHKCFSEQTGLQVFYSCIEGSSQGFEQQVKDFFTQGGKGLNVTAPFKQRAFAMAEQHTERCLLAKSANTLWEHQGMLWADNTDGVGLIRDLSRYTSLKDASILVLGSGGAARGIIHPLLDQKPSGLTVAYRNAETIHPFQADFPQIQCNLIQECSKNYDVLINTTSAGLVLSEDMIAHQPFCYDLSYDVIQDTSFVQSVKQSGCSAVDGLGMLVEQAAESFFLWHGIRPLTHDALLLRS